MITENDYEIYQINKQVFYDKYQKELTQIIDDCLTENYIGSGALRDYDGAKNFQYAYDSEKNPFQAIKISETNFQFPLRNSCCLVKDKTGNPICYQLQIEL